MELCVLTIYTYLHPKKVEEEELVKESFSMCEVLLLLIHVDAHVVFINISCILCSARDRVQEHFLWELSYDVIEETVKDILWLPCLK